MRRIGLVLGAGGCVGVAYHGGVLAAIEEATGWDPRTADVIVGTSAGSLSAALLRSGLPAGDLRAVSEDLPLSLAGSVLAEIGQPHRPTVSPFDLLRPRRLADPAAAVRGLLRPWRATPGGLMAALLPEGLASTDPIAEGLDRVAAGAWPSDPLWVCAVRLGDGQRVVFGRRGAQETTLGRAVAASCAIPWYYRPVRVGAERYVDGGVVSLHNLDLVADGSIDLVVVSAPMSFSGKWPPWRPDTAFRHSVRMWLERDAGRLRRRGIDVIVVAPDTRAIEAMGLDPMDARHRARISRQARRLALESVAGGELGRAFGDRRGLRPGRPAA